MHFQELTEIGRLAREMASAIAPSAISEADHKKILNTDSGKRFRYNFHIDQTDLINYCAIHNINKIISGKSDKVKIGSLSIRSDDIDVDYAVTPPPAHFINAIPGLGRWTDQRFDQKGRRRGRIVTLPEAFSGNDMVDLFNHVRITRSADPSIRAACVSEQNRPETTRALKQALGIPPFITTHGLLESRLIQILCQDALNLEGWSALDRQNVGDPASLQSEPPWWVAPYLLTPHFFYELNTANNPPAFRVARWVVSTECGPYNFYMLYAAMLTPPKHGRSLSAWLPAPLPEKLPPHNAAQLDVLPPCTSAIITRDLHIDVPSEFFPSQHGHIAYPGGISGISPKHISWESLRGRQSYLLLDAVTAESASDILLMYDEILKYSPASLEIIWNASTPISTQPVPSNGPEWVRIKPETLRHFALAAERAIAEKFSQNQRLSEIKHQCIPNGGQIHLLHGAPTIGATTFAMHMALARSRGAPIYSNSTNYTKPHRTLFICHRSKEINLHKLYNIYPFPLPKYFRLLDTGDLIPSLSTTTETPEFLTALSWADIVFLDSPQNNPTKGISPWLHTFRLASHLKETGKLVVIITHSDRMPHIRQFLNHTDSISRIIDTETDDHTARDIVNEFAKTPGQPEELMNIRYGILSNQYGQSLNIIIKSLSKNTNIYKNIKNDNKLTGPEKTILIHLLKNGPSSLSSIKIVDKISRRTLNNIAKNLININLIEMIGKGRAAKYKISMPFVATRYMKFSCSL